MAFLYNRKILYVNLTERKIWKEDISGEMASKFLGSRGINAKILWDRIEPGIDPLGPDNIIILSAGALSGTTAPCSGRSTVSFKSPATGRYCKSCGGAWWGSYLRFTGYDHVVLLEISEKPVYLLIDNNMVELRNAAHLWGKTVTETNNILKRELNDPNVEIASIGPAGENLVKIASIMISTSSAMARGGGGAVMGSKNLKAIVVRRGSGNIDVYDHKGFYQTAIEARHNLANDSGAVDLFKYGTAGLVEGTSAAWLMPSYNFRIGNFKYTDTINGEYHEKNFLKRRMGCVSCAINCHRLSEIKRGQFSGYEAAGPEYEAISAFGSGCGIADMNTIVRASGLCNDLGLDTISAGNIIQWVIECVERGILEKKEVDEIDFGWGKRDAVLETIPKIAFREGFGNLLAEGVNLASKKVGRGSEKWAVHARGLEQSNVDTRGGKGYALSFAVNPRGPDHLTNAAIMEFGFTEETRALVKKITGDEKYATPYLIEKRANMIRWGEDCMAVTDSLGFCMFASAGPAWKLTPANMAKLYTAATGIIMNEEEILFAGRRIVTLERAFNIREGHERKDDSLPYKLMNEKVPEGPLKGSVNSQEELNIMLDEYFTLHEWDLRTGWPTEEAYKNLGLNFVIDELKSLGKIPN